MKNSLVIGLLCLGIGFGAAWLVKPGSTSEETADNSSAKSNNAPPPSPRSAAASSEQPSKSNNRPEDPRPSEPQAVPGFVPGAQDTARGERMQDRFREMMAKRQEAKEEARIKKLVAALGLTDAQAEQLRAHFTKNREKLAALMSGNEGDWSKIKDFTKSLRGDELDAALADILNDDQKVAYDEMKQRDRSNKVEARAYKDLAKVQGVLDLSPDQKDQVYEILHQDADKKIDANKDANAFVSVFTEGLGIDLDPGDLGIADVVQGQIDQAADGGEPARPGDGDWQKMLQENRKKEIDRKVELLAPVLDDGQKDTYRSHLESQGVGLFGGVLQGANLEVQQGEIPVPEPADE